MELLSDYYWIFNSMDDVVKYYFEERDKMVQTENIVKKIR